ncbi:MAG: ribosomal-processing cysteine protease Prp [Huintestinicola sp.]
MIKAVFSKENGLYSGFDLCGHAEFAEYGQDIVCASVSSAAQLVINTITDHFCDDAEVYVQENRLGISIRSGCDASHKLIASFKEHLGFIGEEFPHTIKITVK